MAHTIHPAAELGFTLGADAYERGRPTYPPGAVAAIAEALGLGPGRTVLELGAGTGRLTSLLAPTGARVLAVEPVAAMRARLLEAVPGVEAVGSTAEAIALPNGSVDAIAVAQAFHWFDAVRALSEMHRVLRPGGRAALVFNRRDESVPWVRAMGEAIRRLSGDAPQVAAGAWREALGLSALFGPWQTLAFRHVQRLTPDGVLDRAASVSYVAAAEPARRAAVLEEVRAAVAADPATAGAAEVELPYDTEVLWAERVSMAPGDAGIVACVNANGGGVPKPQVASAGVGANGLDIDAHTEPEPVHGGPDQAVCLYSQEAIERVRADGHTAFPGALGENLTLLGIDWGRLRAGDRLVVGEGEGAVRLELTKFATPCQTIAHWFDRGRIARVSGRAHPLDARWHTRVLRGGEVRPGMPARVERG